MPPLHAYSSARRSTSRPRGTLLASLALAVTLTGCTSADGDSDPGGDPAAEGGPSQIATTLEVRTTVSRVAGDLPRRQRARVERQVGRLLERYLSAAYLHERPGGGYRGSFPGFTRDARRLALQDVRTTSDAAFRKADEVRPRGAVAFVSAVAPEGRPVGATARVFLDLHVTQDDRRRLVEVRGRLLLTPVPDGWRVFGYDLALGDAPRGKKR